MEDFLVPRDRHKHKNGSKMNTNDDFHFISSSISCVFKGFCIAPWHHKDLAWCTT